MKCHITFKWFPVFVCLYFTVSFIPLAFHGQSEILPFFSFKLYSKIPDGFVRNDLLIIDENGNESFLLFKNRDLTELERKYFNCSLSKWNKDESLNDRGLELRDHRALDAAQSIWWVEMSGDYLEVMNQGSYSLSKIERLR